MNLVTGWEYIRSVSTAQTLDEVNRRFYARFADAFDQSRHHGWQGWHDLMPLLPSRPLRILDLGCGNGRLAEFLDRTAEAHDPVASYVGRDRCEALLDHARGKTVSSTHFETWSWFDMPETARETPKPEYDWVTLFGVMHHVYGYAARLELLHWASRWLRPGGLLSVSFWNFGASEQFLKRRFPGPTWRPSVSMRPHWKPETTSWMVGTSRHAALLPLGEPRGTNTAER